MGDGVLAMKLRNSASLVLVLLCSAMAFAQVFSPSDAICLEQQSKLEEAAHAWQLIVSRNPASADPTHDDAAPEFEAELSIDPMTPRPKLTVAT
jgi:hypothetical protein